LQVDLSAPSSDSAAAFPRLAHARGREVVLQPGDVLFLPAYWWHEVTTLPVPPGELAVSVSFWSAYLPT